MGGYYKKGILKIPSQAEISAFNQTSKINIHGEFVKKKIVPFLVIMMLTSICNLLLLFTNKK